MPTAKNQQLLAAVRPTSRSCSTHGSSSCSSSISSSSSSSGLRLGSNAAQRRSGSLIGLSKPVITRAHTRGDSRYTSLSHQATNRSMPAGAQVSPCSRRHEVAGPGTGSRPRYIDGQGRRPGAVHVAGPRGAWRWSSESPFYCARAQQLGRVCISTTAPSVRLFDRERRAMRAGHLIADC
jgi:hypothetical protein